jgi:hypothetical protein
MARRNRPRPSGRRPQPGGDRTRSLGSHWRADGAPKATYTTQSEALSVADERAVDAGVGLNVYQCDFCHGWHMGSAGGRER